MSISDQLKIKVNNAYQDFKQKVSEETHDKALELLHKIHENSLELLNNGEASTEGSEFSHALAALDKIPENSSELPTSSEFTTRVKSNGELLGTGKWELLDTGWLEALEQWFIHLEWKAPFNKHPVTITIPDDVSIAIAGDWGTGNWRENAPSTLVSEQMVKLKADYTIHLGDVYYAGTEEEEINNLVESWPVGRMGCFTLNSNHEMYNGAFSYFDQALAKKFVQQKGCSFFALENKHWLIVGLDTAYHADPFDLYLKGKLDHTQIDWLKSLNKDNKRIIVLSHHEGYGISGHKKGSTYNQVVEGLGCEPDFWYWGHLHNGIVYQPKGNFYGRCIGHAAIPYGNASMLNDESSVEWYETALAGDPDIPERVLNGFAWIKLSNDQLEEKIIAENGNIRVHHSKL